jgi:hypothetical protein
MFLQSMLVIFGTMVAMGAIFSSLCPERRSS